MVLVFVPFKNGKPSSQWEILADGFAGYVRNRFRNHAIAVTQGDVKYVRARTK